MNLFIKAILTIAPLTLIACMPTESGNSEKPTSSRESVNMKYVADSLTVFKSCWYPTSKGTDSLAIEGKRYTVSSRSRYRAAPEPETFGDMEAEGAVTLFNPEFFVDTKATQDSIIVLNRCEGK